jgi:gas vesicle protein
MQLNQIDRNTPEGKLLWAALIILTTSPSIRIHGNEFNGTHLSPENMLNQLEIVSENLEAGRQEKKPDSLSFGGLEVIVTPAGLLFRTCSGGYTIDAVQIQNLAEFLDKYLGGIRGISNNLNELLDALSRPRRTWQDRMNEMKGRQEKKTSGPERSYQSLSDQIDHLQKRIYELENNTRLELVARDRSGEVTNLRSQVDQMDKILQDYSVKIEGLIKIVANENLEKRIQQLEEQLITAVGNTGKLLETVQSLENTQSLNNEHLRDRIRAIEKLDIDQRIAYLGQKTEEIYTLQSRVERVEQSIRVMENGS